VAPDGRLVGLLEFIDGVGKPIVNFAPDILSTPPVLPPQTDADR
jgi:hypothetical protein